ncbi:MAG TPA: TonB-dependent receptor [Bacteroidales bacterium]|nr:TonB-dependent receptor [Bacteroidales bacterium]
MKKILLPFLFLPLMFYLVVLTGLPLSAQNATVRGFVYEKETGEPVIFTNVYFYKTSIGAATDINGYFVITKIPPGEYTLMVTSMGFDTIRIPMTLHANDLISKKLYLPKSSVMLEEINVSATRQDRKVETQTSIIKITPKQIEQIPTIGGQPDLAQYLQVLPGVIFTGDQGGQLYIRGGPPVQNKVILDGMTIYNPFHSIGLFSVFDVDIIKNVDVYTGGFNAEYGGRISSIMDITTRDGNKKRFAGKIDASTFGAKLLLEGPIVKEKDENSTSASWIFSIKNSYLEESSKIFYKYIDPNGLPYDYLDIYGKISVNAPNGSKVCFYGFDFSDDVKYKAIQNYGWNSYGGGANFVVIPGKTPMLLEGYVDYSSYLVTLDEVNRSPRSSSIAGFTAGLNFTYFFGKDAIKYGLEMNGYKTTLDFYNSVNRVIDYTQNTTELNGYVKYKWMLKKFIIEPGLRLQYYASLAEISFEPRLAVKYNVTDHFRLKMAGGLYSQNLISTTYDLDVVNLFYGFLAGPDNLPSTFEGKKVTSKLQKSDQIVLGFELDLFKNLFLNVEGYYKYYPQLTNLNRNKLYDDTPENADKPDYLKKDFIIEKGDAEGVDVSLKYDIRQFHFWLVYSLCYIHRNDGISTYVPPYDRRHNVNLTASYLFGKRKSWELDARWNYGSGFPFTQTQGFYEELNFNNIFDNYTTQNGNLGILYAGFDEGRLPYYSRLDLNLKKNFELGKYTRVDISFSITNVLNQENIFYFDRVTYTRINQLPFMPSLGVSFAF